MNSLLFVYVANSYTHNIIIVIKPLTLIQNQLTVHMDSLVNLTLWSQDAYRLEIISAHSEKVWSTAYTNFVLRKSTDFIDCWLVSNLSLRCKNKALISVMCIKVNAKRCACLLSWFLLYWRISEVGLTPINNWQSLSILQNKICIGSWPDPFWVGAYILQSISTLQPKGLVHETSTW